MSGGDVRHAPGDPGGCGECPINLAPNAPGASQRRLEQDSRFPGNIQNILVSQNSRSSNWVGRCQAGIRAGRRRETAITPPRHD